MTDPAHRPYDPPELVVHGDLEELTEGFGASPTDATSGDTTGG